MLYLSSRSRAKLFGIIPAGGDGDFMVDLTDVRVKLIVTIRAGETAVNMEMFKIDISWGDISFKFDNLAGGLSDLADKLMNQLGVGGTIVRKQKELIMAEIKNMLRGLTECAMYHPSRGMDTCMRDFWIGLGWEWPWVYPTCQ